MSCSVEYRDIKKVYPSLQGDVQAVGGVTFDVTPGSFVSIVGPSGCGKSTLLQIAAGLTSGSSGEVLLNGRRIDGPPREAVYLFQQYTKSVFPWKTVFDNVAFGLRYRQAGGNRPSADEIATRCDQMIDMVGLKRFRNYYPYQLSGGMQQRVAIARALVCQPGLLLMDEPFSAVDALTRADLQDGLLDLWMTLRPTIMFITHDIDEAVYLSERVIVLSHPPSRVSQNIVIDLPYPRDQIETREHPLVMQSRRAILADIKSRPAATAMEINQ
jgi:NitT/TauT family transport system ATP-binding protein